MEGLLAILLGGIVLYLFFLAIRAIANLIKAAVQIVSIIIMLTLMIYTFNSPDKLPWFKEYFFEQKQDPPPKKREELPPKATPRQKAVAEIDTIYI